MNYLSPTNKPVSGSNVTTALCLDFLVMTAHVSEEHQNWVKKEVIDLPQHIDGFAQYQSNKADYKIICRLVFENGGWMQIEAHPKKPGASFLRVSLQPSLVGIEGIKTMKFALMGMFMGGYGEFVQRARATRIDCAVDCIGVGINDLGFLAGVSKKCAVHMSSANGVESIYLGSKYSNAQFNIYNKQLQLSEVHGINLSQPTTRIERRLKHGHRPLVKLIDLPNPFSGLSVVSTNILIPGQEPDLVRMFNLAARSAGLPAAYNALSKARRPMYRKAVKEQCVSWWEPEQLWAQWPAAVNGLGLLHLGKY